MKTYKMCVPVTVFVYFDVQAEDEDAALDAEMPGLPYNTSDGGVSVPDGMKICFGSRDNVDYQKMEAEEEAVREAEGND